MVPEGEAADLLGVEVRSRPGSQERSEVMPKVERDLSNLARVLNGFFDWNHQWNEELDMKTAELCIVILKQILGSRNETMIASFEELDKLASCCESESRDPAVQELCSEYRVILESIDLWHRYGFIGQD
jgi:hypothetical protein